MSRMFKSITRTWNVFTGCRHNCKYCSARTLAIGRLKHHPRYRDGFKPTFHPELLDIKFQPGEFVFVAYMGDVAFCPINNFADIEKKIWANPQTAFLLMSKDPRVFNLPFTKRPPNEVLGTTLETNRDYEMSLAPSPEIRAHYLALVKHPRKMVSIEPIMDFDLDPFLNMVEKIKPQIIEVGADNYHNHLPEPLADKLRHLLHHLRLICPKVVEKDGLKRLLKGV
jgi:hypothetical protein